MFGRRKDPARLHAKGDVGGLVAALAPHKRDLMRDDDRWVDVGWKRRAEAAQLLGSHEDGEDALLDACQDRSPVVRLAVMTALVERSTTHAGALVDAALLLDERRLRAEAAQLLLRHAAEGDAAAPVLEAYADSTVDGESALEDDWVGAVAERLDPPARLALARRISPTLARAGTRTWQLARLDIHAAARAVLPELEDPERREAALGVLGRLRSPVACQRVADLADAQDPLVRRSAISALGAIRHPSGVESILRATVDDDPSVRDAAIDALDRLGTAGNVWGMASMAQELVAGADAGLDGAGPTLVAAQEPAHPAPAQPPRAQPVRRRRRLRWPGDRPFGA